MRSNVTAILVAKHQGDELDATIQAIRAQTVQPDRIIVVASGPTSLAEYLGRQGFDQVLSMNPKASFGDAVKAGVQATLPGREWLWMLAEDSAPEPEALNILLTRVRSTGTAAVAGPKLVDWDDPSRIIELSQGLTQGGARWVLDRQELDQQQYDHYEDVLGVGPVGMLVRRDVWDQLGGFDPALPIYDDGLDFSVRARLAGYRVIVVPEARLRFARAGVAGPKINHRGRVLRKAHRQARAAQLHRRVTYAPAILAPFLWLALPVIGVLGMIWAVIRERPGTMLGELWAALSVFFRPGRIFRSRSRIRNNSRAGWGAVRPLRTDRKTVRAVRAVRKEAILAVQGRQKQDLHFVTKGGLGLLVVSALASAGILWWLFNASFLGSGQLSASVTELWASTISAAAVNVQQLGSFMHSIPADSFTWVLALLGTVTFWNPSYALVLLVLLTIPASALGAWMWAARLTESAAGRVFAGFAWAFSPLVLVSIQEARFTTLVVLVTLPWVLFAGTKAKRSWSWAGITSFLTAIVLAAAPTLIPAAVVILVVGTLANPRGITKILSIAIVPLTLFAPKVLHAIATGRIAEFFIDPGHQTVYTPGTVPELMVGFPTGNLPVLFGVDPWLMTLIAVAPLMILALLGAFTGVPRRTILIAAMAALGLITAVVSAATRIVPLGDELVPLWTGSGLALYWLGLISLAAIGVPMLFKGQLVGSAVAILGVVVLSLPSIMSLATGTSHLQPNRSPLPAVAQAESATDPDAQTLFLTPLGEDGVRANLVTGKHLLLNHLRTASLESDRSETLATLVGELASSGATGLTEDLAAAHIKFVVLEEPRDASGAPTRALMQAVFDQSDALTSVGTTSYGLLWRVNDLPESDSGDASSTESELATDELDIATTSTRPVSGQMIWAAQLTILVLMFLLSLPTGEVRAQPERRRKTARPAVAVPASAPEGEPAAETGPEAEPAQEAEPASEPLVKAKDVELPETELPDEDTIFVQPQEVDDEEQPR